MAPRDLVSVGVITGAHGIRGEVKLRSFTAAPDALVRYAPLKTATGGTIEIALQRRGTQAQVTVHDQGPGIPAFADDKVFEKFYSLARPHTQRRSTGLGLAFVKQIAPLRDAGVSLRNADRRCRVATL